MPLIRLLNGEFHEIIETSLLQAKDYFKEILKIKPYTTIRIYSQEGVELDDSTVLEQDGMYNLFVDKYTYDWVDIEKLDKDVLSQNPSAVRFLENFPGFIDWISIWGNPSAIPLIKKYNPNWPDFSTKLSIYDLCRNSSMDAILLVEQYIENKVKKGDYDKLINNTFQRHITQNKNFTSLLRKYQDLINWDIFLSHSDAIDLIQSHIKQPSFQFTPDSVFYLSLNENASKLLDEHIIESMDRNSFNHLLDNPDLLPLINKFPFRIDFCLLAENTNPDVIPLLEKYIKETTTIANNQFFWRRIATNPLCVYLVRKHIYDLGNVKKVFTDTWASLARNTNPDAIDLLKEYIKYLSNRQVKYIWRFLPANPNAFGLIETRLDLINYKALSSNEKLFV